MPIAIIAASIILGGSIIFASTRMSAQQGIAVSRAPATAAVPAANPVQQVKAVDVKTVKLASPIIGSPTAPVAIAYWYDYRCSFCKKFGAEVMDNVYKDYVRTGKVRVVFKSHQFLTADSTAYGIAERAVWEAAPSKFYDWHKLVFENQSQATKANIPGLTEQALGKAYADKVMALIAAKGDTYQKAIEADRTEGSTFGIRSTPSSVIGKQLVIGAKSYAEIKAAIDAALK